MEARREAVALLLPLVEHSLLSSPGAKDLAEGNDSLALLFRDSLLGYIAAPVGTGRGSLLSAGLENARGI